MMGFNNVSKTPYVFSFTFLLKACVRKEYQSDVYPLYNASKDW